MILLKDILNIIFTSNCAVCGKSFYYNKQNAVCGNCFKKLKKTPVLYCKSCGKQNENCQECLKNRKYDYIEVFTKATPDVIKILAVYKLKKIKPLSKNIAALIENDLVSFVKNNNVDLITYIPLDKRTYKEREFNHLEEILKHIFPSYMIEKALIKTKKTQLQAKLSKKERVENLKGTFSLIKNVKNKRVLIFDDILTTGATLQEAYRTLKKGNPSKIYSYVIAR